MKICKKCVIPENFPHVNFDRHGVCNLCRGFEGKEELAKLRKIHEKKFRELIAPIAGKKDYDILMCYSGGKDSTYTLEILKKRYSLNVLAYTFDNGFIPERTYVNIRNVVEKLKVDHVFFKPRFDILKKIFNLSLKGAIYAPKAIERASTVCTSCMGLVKYSSLRLAIEKDIPLIAFGWSPGQAPVTSSILKIDPAMMQSMESAIKKPLSGIVGDEIDNYFPKKTQFSDRGRFPAFVHPLGFLDYNEARILKDISRLGWKMPTGIDLNATNCLLNSLADERHIKRYHFHPYVLEIAAFVRQGVMTRAEGIKHLPSKKDPGTLKLVKKRLVA